MSTPALPGQPYQTPPRTEWMDPEKWVWQQLCEGKVADFNALHQETLDPESKDGWSDKRLISPAFLETILLYEPFRSALPHQGVRIRGAWIKAPINLEHARVGHPWWLEESRVDAEVRLTNAHSAYSISFAGTVFNAALILLMAKVGGVLTLIGAKCTGTLDMGSLEVGQHLFMSEGAEFGDVVVRGAKVGGQLSFIGAKCTGALNMDSLEVGQHLFMSEGAEFGEVVLTSARVGGQLSFIGAKCTGKLNMDSLEVGQHLFMSEGAQFGEVNLGGAKVSGELSLIGAKCMGTLNMNGLEVGEHLLMREGKFKNAIRLVFATIDSSLDLSGSEFFSVLDLAGTQVGGELSLGSGRHPKPVWHESSQLILRNATVGAVQDGGEEGAWPKDLDLDGFTYTRLGGFYSGEDGNDIATRKPKWFITQWLARDRTYSPQPYHQLASVLQAAGRPQAANAVLYAGKERERQEATGLKWWGLSLLNWTIGYGYGYRYFFSLLWVIGLTLVGVAALYSVKPDIPPSFPTTLPKKFAFSFDLLLPIIKLDESHKITFEGWQRYYFYFHQLLGFILGSFVVAGLSGITKK